MDTLTGVVRGAAVGSVNVMVVAVVLEGTVEAMVQGGVEKRLPRNVRFGAFGVRTIS